jgi:hypothetical protein
MQTLRKLPMQAPKRTTNGVKKARISFIVVSG